MGWRARSMGDCLIIPLTNGGTFQIDPEDYEALPRSDWYANGQPGYRYVVSRVGGKMVYLHRVIMHAPRGIGVDHRNGDKFDNRRANLRLATQTQNNANQPVPKHNTSGYKGVTWEAARGKWRAQLHIRGKHRHLGRFTCPLEAAAAYDSAAVEAFGEYAQTNAALGLV